MRRLLALFVVAVTATVALAACAPAGAAIEISSDTVIIDVRTPEEYASGHLDGAVNIDVQSPEFDGLVSALPADGDYVVYCRSGNRSAQAIARMEGLGFSDLTDAGGLDAAANATGLSIVTAP